MDPPRPYLIKGRMAVLIKNAGNTNSSILKLKWLSNDEISL